MFFLLPMWCIPVWHVEGSGVFPVTTEYVVARNEAEAYTKAKAKFGDAVKLKQECIANISNTLATRNTHEPLRGCCEAEAGMYC